MKLDILDVGAIALNAFQYGAAISAENISQSANPDYNRQAVRYSSSRPGVKVSVQSIRDSFLATQMNLAKSQASEARTMAAFAARTDQFVTSLQGHDRAGPYNFLNRNLQNFFGALSRMNTHVSEASCHEVIEQAVILSHTINVMSARLSDQMAHADNQIRDSVLQINTLIKQIAKLNEKMSERPESSFLALINERDRLVGQLAHYVSVRMVEKNRQINLFLAGGQPLVSGRHAMTLKVKKDVYGHHPVISLGDFNLSDRYRFSGKLGGLLQARNHLLPGVQSRMGRFATTLAQLFNQINQRGYVTSYGVPLLPPSPSPSPQNPIPLPQQGKAIFEPMQFRAIAASTNKGQAGITINIATSTAKLGELKDASYEIKALGSGEYRVKNLMTGTVSPPMDKTKLENAIAGMSLVIQGNIPKDARFLVVPMEQAAAAIKVITGPDDLALSKNKDGSGVENSNSFSVLDGVKVMGGRETLTQGLGTIFAWVGSQSQKSESLRRSAGALFKQVRNEKDSVSGIDLQEEYINLLHFQKAYSAATKIISTDRAMFNAILSAMGG